MYDVFAGLRIIPERLAGPPGDRFICRVDIENLHILCVQRPENLFDIPGHLLKPLFTLAQGLFRQFPPGDVAEHGHVPAWKVVRLRRVFNKDCLAVASQNPRLSMLALAVEEAVPAPHEISSTSEKLLNRLAYEFLAAGSKQLQCCGICFKANCLVIEK